MTTPKEPTGLYGRVSKDDPKRMTIELQQKTLSSWVVQDARVSVAGEYWDEGVSGTIPIWERPKGRQLIRDMEKGMFKNVAVAKADRFGRTLLDGLQAVKRLEDSGVKLIAVDEGWDARRNDSPLYFQFRMMMAEEEHRRIRERMRDGKLRAMDRDNAPPGGNLTFGYRFDSRGQFVIDPVEGPIVIGIFERYLSGWSQRQILAWAETVGIPAGRRCQKRAEGSECRIVAKHTEASWSGTRIGRILRNRTYTGIRIWKGRQFPCPALVDVPAFEKVQIKLLDRQPSCQLEWNPEHGLLSGLLECATCGDKFYSRRRTGSPHREYVCNTALTHWAQCKAKTLRMTRLDAKVWELVEGYLHNPRDLVERVLQADAGLRGEAEELEVEEQAIAAELQQLDGQAEAIWAEQRAKNWPVAWVSAGLDQLARRKRSLEARRSELSKRRAHVLIDRDRSGEVTAALARIRADLAAGLTPHKRREILRLMIAEGKVTTIGSGKGKFAEVALRLRWGEVPRLLSSCKDTSDCSEVTPHDLALSVVFTFGPAA